MPDFEYRLAHDLDSAWLNFELDLPLPPMPDGAPNPFYVNRPGNPVAQLERALLRPYYRPPKYFFSGHRGCGKSTELLRLAANPAIQDKFWPVHFSIRNLADINDLDYKDVLLAIGGQLFSQYQTRSQRGLKRGLLDELDSWRGAIEESITTLKKGGVDIEVGGRLTSFFAEVSGKLKLEPTTRAEIRQLFERNITDLVRLVGQIAGTITSQEGRPPLVLIDDLDKADLSKASEIFYAQREIMLQPECAIVYTVSSPLFYSPHFEAIKDQAIFLPNIKLHPQGQSQKRDREGYATLQAFVHKRLQADRIGQEALNLAVHNSGGVFRELARVMRGALDRAGAAGRDKISRVDVEGAAAEIRSAYWRLLTAEQRALLRQVRANNRMDHPDKLAPLLQMLAVLEYANGQPWCDVHPALEPLLEQETPGNDHSDAG